jgi:hypothetical protein
MSGKKYSFATTVLGGRMLDDKSNEYNQEVAYNFMQQLSVKAALKQWGRRRKSSRGEGNFSATLKKDVRSQANV